MASRKYANASHESLSQGDTERPPLCANIEVMAEEVNLGSWTPSAVEVSLWPSGETNDEGG